MAKDASTPKKHKALKVIVGIIAIFAVIGIIGSLSSSNSSNTGNNNSSSSSSGSSSSAATPGLNQPADDGKLEFTVTSFTCGKTTLSNDNEFEGATAQGQFCIMGLHIKNIGTESQQFDASAQNVYTSDDKQYSSDSDGTTAANPSGTDCNYQDVNPGNEIDCNVAFDMPQGLTPVYAKLHDSTFSGGVRVNLQ
jgi:hypothetical protein